MRHWLALIIVFSLPITLSAQGHRGKGEPRLDKSLLELPAIRKSDVVLVYNGFFKAVLRREGRSWYSIAFLFDNDGHKQPVKSAVVSVNEVEALVGFDLFTNLWDLFEEKVESQANWEEWKR